MAEKPIESTVETVESDITGATPDQQSIMQRPDYTPAPLGGMSGSAVDQVNYRLPRLKIAYGVGGLAVHFNQGDLVLNVGGKNGDFHLLAPKGQALNVIFLSVDSYWKQFLPKEAWDAGERPKEFRTTAEVEAAGGTWEMPPYGSGRPLPSYGGAAHIKLFIEKPKETVCGLFGVEAAGNLYAPAIWSIDKGGYRSVMPVLKNDLGFALSKRGLLGGTYSIVTSVTVDTKSNRTKVLPNIKLVRHHSDEVVAELKKLLRDISFDVADEDSEPVPF